MNIKQRLNKLESSVVVKTESVKLRPRLSREQWLNVFGGQNIEAEPLTIEQQEWVDKYGRVS
jgi:hypothetical protein